MDKHSDDIIQWLAPPDVSSNFNRALQARHPGSGQRLLASNAYTRWENGDNSFLWLRGSSGCGKTILASTIIEDLQQSQSHTVLYFYFDFTDNRKQSLESTLRSFIWQIYCQSKHTHKYLHEIYSSACQGGKEPSFDSLQWTFTQMIGNFDKDSSMQVDVHLLVTSRPEQDIESSIQCYASKEAIEIQYEMLEADIRNYVYARVRQQKAFRQLFRNYEIQAEIEVTLLNAGGTFRWVSCQLDSLGNCPTRNAGLKLLRNLPRTLEDTYDGILATIPLVHMHYIKRILQLLTYSERPLRLEEAVDAIAVDIGKTMARGQRFNPKNRLPAIGEIISCCSSLVVLVLRKGGHDEEPRIPEIQLAHLSVKDYLYSNPIPSAQYLQGIPAGSSIARVCLSYLLDLPRSATVKEIRKSFPFAQYAAQYWADYTIMCKRKSGFEVQLAKELLCNPNRPWEIKSKVEDIASALYYSSLMGLPRCVRMLLEVGADVNAHSGRYDNGIGNALSAASFGGHETIARLLIDHGADVNARGGRYGNSLQAASFGGHEATMKLLVNKGANVNARGGFYGNALSAASSGGHEAIVRLLINHGANVNARGGFYGNSISAAASGGYVGIVKMLMNEGADLAAAGSNGQTPVFKASSHGHAEVVRILLNRGVDLTVADNDRVTPIQAASSKGHSEVVKMLLDNGADCSVADDFGWTPLIFASSRGYAKVVQAPLDRGADLTVTDNDGWTPLNAASSKGYTEIVKILLGQGANCGVADNSGWTLLLLASSKGYTEVVKMLLDRGADWTVADSDGLTPLNTASRQGHIEIVKMLLDKGANWTVADQSGFTERCGEVEEEGQQALELGKRVRRSDRNWRNRGKSSTFPESPDANQVLQPIRTPVKSKVRTANPYISSRMTNTSSIIRKGKGRHIVEHPEPEVTNSLNVRLTASHTETSSSIPHLVIQSVLSNETGITASEAQGLKPNEVASTIIAAGAAGLAGYAAAQSKRSADTAKGNLDLARDVHKYNMKKDKRAGTAPDSSDSDDGGSRAPVGDEPSGNQIVLLPRVGPDTRAPTSPIQDSPLIAARTPQATATQTRISETHKPAQELPDLAVDFLFARLSQLPTPPSHLPHVALALLALRNLPPTPDHEPDKDTANQSGGDLSGQDSSSDEDIDGPPQENDQSRKADSWHKFKGTRNGQRQPPGKLFDRTRQPRSLSRHNSLQRSLLDQLTDLPSKDTLFSSINGRPKEQ
ncbi:hypothetical protein PFICI_00959 [Pestalotiopsis fici W106-1]|uniref:Nephrocystin 3-like N-terminal domain-containing protein n=1 Tax=Pestalotiopsis fici (strain W106-1 / CGMCC3.15140) TaxID=1229662 RepID=W3XPE8_PESFW|nr:uncharacterized protein PFICI_00959 [Pestalotiopsis fici W106-1]ETS87131.1 hypothetical protein PFICI_00959 [Pestalotiopsis fici W106-1]